MSKPRFKGWRIVFFIDGKEAPLQRVGIQRWKDFVVVLLSATKAVLQKALS